MAAPNLPRNKGFDGRTFLTASEWAAFCRRKPVRYIRKCRGAVCLICGQPGTPDNPLQNAHVIGFDIGIIDLALTPDFLDSDANVLTAHRRKCNQTAELDLRASMVRLQALGITQLPDFLPAFIDNLWREVKLSADARSMET